MLILIPLNETLYISPIVLKDKYNRMMSFPQSCNWCAGFAWKQIPLPPILGERETFAISIYIRLFWYIRQICNFLVNLPNISAFCFPMYDFKILLLIFLVSLKVNRIHICHRMYVWFTQLSFFFLNKLKSCRNNFKNTNLHFVWTIKIAKTTWLSNIIFVPILETIRFLKVCDM